MPYNKDYDALNARCREMRAAMEQAAQDLFEARCNAPRPSEQVDPDHYARMKTSEAEAIRGLTDPNPSVRLTALALFGEPVTQDVVDVMPEEVFRSAVQPVWNATADIVPAVLAMALGDPDIAVQQYAAVQLRWFYPSGQLDIEAARKLADVALHTQDVILQHFIYRELICFQRHRWGFHEVLDASLDLIQTKYYLWPILFDAEHIQQIVSEDAPRPAAQSRPTLGQRLRRLVSR